MAEYRISGIWKRNGIITHYAVHTRTQNADKTGYEIGKAEKMTKTAAVSLLSLPNNTAHTYLWNYTLNIWESGGEVHVVDGTPPFLRTNHDQQFRDNLSHLPNYSYVW